MIRYMSLILADLPVCELSRQYKQQSKFDFGFVPLTHAMMPNVAHTNTPTTDSVAELHKKVKSYGCHNYLGACIPLRSQLKGLST